MQKGKLHIETVKHPLSFFRASLNISFILFFAFLFTYLHTAAAANVSFNETVFSKYSKAAISSDKDQRATHPFHIPFESDSSENESLDNDEDERNEQHQEHDSFFLYSHTISLSLTEKFFCIQLGRSVQPGCDHNPVPLFILFHSWKSYLLS